MPEAFRPSLDGKPRDRRSASQEPCRKPLPIRNPSIDSNGRRPESLRSKKRHTSTTRTEEQAKWQKPFKLGVGSEAFKIIRGL